MPRILYLKITFGKRRPKTYHDFSLFFYILFQTYLVFTTNHRNSKWLTPASFTRLTENHATPKLEYIVHKAKVFPIAIACILLCWNCKHSSEYATFAKQSEHIEHIVEKYIIHSFIQCFNRRAKFRQKVNATKCCSKNNNSSYIPLFIQKKNVCSQYCVAHKTM